jgi:hypothetical protein
MTTTEINKRQRQVLLAVAEHGTGASLNTNTARALERRGLIEIVGTPWDSRGGATAHITDEGRKVARIWFRILAEERRARGLSANYWTRMGDQMTRELER